MNNGPVIDKTNIDQAIDIMNLNRFINEMAYRENISGDVTGDVISQLAKILNDNNISLVYNDMATNGIIQQFDTDTIETSSIADNYEISSGGIYLPDNNVMTSTIEGCNLANAKNDYLNKRMSIGEDAPVEQVQTLLKEYYDNIDFDSVLQYFNN